MRIASSFIYLKNFETSVRLKNTKTKEFVGKSNDIGMFNRKFCKDSEKPIFDAYYCSDEDEVDDIERI